MRQLNRYHAVSLLAAVALVRLALMDVPDAYGGAADEDRIVLALDRDQNNMDPFLHFQRSGILMNINMYDSLLHKTPKLQYEPSLATEWRAIDDTTWEFKLRKGVKFHSGDLFSAEDVKFTFERVLNPETKSPQIGNVRAIKEVKVIDDHTVQLVTDKPFPLLLERMVFFPIMPKKHFEKVGAQAFAEQAPSGTGPYKFAEWKRDQYLRLERFEEHWRGPASIKTFIIRVIPETATQVAELKTGGVDIVRSLPPDLMPDLKANPNTYVSTAPILRTHFVSLDMRHPPFDNKEVRQAANYAIDRQAIIEKLMGGLGKHVPTVINPMAFGHDSSYRTIRLRSQESERIAQTGGLSQWASISHCIRALARHGTGRSPKHSPRCSQRWACERTSRSGIQDLPGISSSREKAKRPMASSAAGGTTRHSMPMPSSIPSTTPNPVAGLGNGIPAFLGWIS